MRRRDSPPPAQQAFGYVVRTDLPDSAPERVQKSPEKT